MKKMVERMVDDDGGRVVGGWWLFRLREEKDEEINKNTLHFQLKSQLCH